MRCLVCQQPSETPYHPACARRLFGREDPPQMPYALEDLSHLAQRLIEKSGGVTGAQKKMSLHTLEEGSSHKLTFVGLWGEYILKPPVKAYRHLPENEALTLNLAEIWGVAAVPHGLIRLQSGELAYLTRRIDRRGIQQASRRPAASLAASPAEPSPEKLPMEDMAQLTGRLTEDKYKSSHERIAKAIRRHSTNTLFDILRFFEQTLVTFLTGNADMHLKNFSLLTDERGISLAPAYDMINTRLVIPEKDDPEELALTLGGRRRKLRRTDFEAAGASWGLTNTQIRRVFLRFGKQLPQVRQTIRTSFLPEDLQEEYLQLVQERAERLEL